MLTKLLTKLAESFASEDKILETAADAIFTAIAEKILEAIIDLVPHLLHLAF